MAAFIAKRLEYRADQLEFRGRQHVAQAYVMPLDILLLSLTIAVTVDLRLKRSSDKGVGNV
ncbi:hypothetical protein [Bacillus sp. JCM 19034]|uniref:hypothetical protein n=1 Tax=Bacillus sp. JCM 19034 TaxID=1481928 RepID=UPI000785F6FE|nr:hypothetical protein [Bacillus sp. JCM 19034]